MEKSSPGNPRISLISKIRKEIKFIKNVMLENRESDFKRA